MLTTWPVTVSMRHPVADAARLLELDRDAAPQVAERLLRRERQRTGHDRGRRDEAREVDADGVQPVDHVADERQRYDELVQDPRDLAPREQRLEREQHDDLDHAERDDRKAGFAREQRTPSANGSRSRCARTSTGRARPRPRRRASPSIVCRARRAGERARSARSTSADRREQQRVVQVRVEWHRRAVRPLGIAAIIGPAPCVGRVESAPAPSRTTARWHPERAARSSSPTCWRQRATHAFGVPGESYPRRARRAARRRATGCRFIVCRQEGGAAYMAEAYGKLTGRPGIAFVTRGPGASNAAVGIHTAAQDSTPMIVFVGQVGSDLRRPRGVPGDRLSAHVRQRRQVGGADRSRRAHPRVRRACVSARDVGPARARRAGAARRHADVARRLSPTRRASSRSPPRRRATTSRAAEALLARCAPAARARRRQPLGRRRARGAARASPRRTTCRSRARFATRTSSTTAIRITRATSASASIRSSPRACATPTCCSSSASGWAK